MVPVKLESLTTSELLNLAEQEKIEDFEGMERDELIMSLTEKAEEERSNSESDDGIARTVNVKNVSSLSDNANHSDLISSLPGSEGLPESYHDTFIHFIFKNSDWGYVFWSVSSIEAEAIEEKKGMLVLVVTMTDREGRKENYDIFVGDDDTTWNIGFSRDAVSCFVSLYVETPDGKRDLLVQSNSLSLPSSYWLDHGEEMKKNDTLFKVYLSAITTKTGELIDNRTVQAINSLYREEDYRK